MSWSYMTSHVIDLIKLGQFYIITHSKIDLLLIICHLTYLIFLVNFPNQIFESSYAINLFIESVALRAYNILLF